MKYHSKSQYHDAFAAMVKITMRDGDASESEIIFLENLMYKLSLTNEEYEFIMQNYMKYPIDAPFLFDERINALYELGKILNTDQVLTGDSRNRWFERLGKAIGLEPNSIHEVVSKALALTEKAVDFDTFNAQIRSVMTTS